MEIVLFFPALEPGFVTPSTPVQRQRWSMLFPLRIGEESASSREFACAPLSFRPTHARMMLVARKHRGWKCSCQWGGAVSSVGGRSVNPATAGKFRRGNDVTGPWMDRSRPSPLYINLSRFFFYISLCVVPPLKSVESPRKSDPLADSRNPFEMGPAHRALNPLGVGVSVSKASESLSFSGLNEQRTAGYC